MARPQTKPDWGESVGFGASEKWGCNGASRKDTRLQNYDKGKGRSSASERAEKSLNELVDFQKLDTTNYAKRGGKRGRTGGANAMKRWWARKVETPEKRKPILSKGFQSLGLRCKGRGGCGRRKQQQSQGKQAPPCSKRHKE